MPEAYQQVAGGCAQRHHRSRGPEALHPGRDASCIPLRLLDRGCLGGAGTPSGCWKISGFRIPVVSLRSTTGYWL